MTIQQRFPIGTHVINLTSIHAVVAGYWDYSDGTTALILREVKPSGKLSRYKWAADPDKCVKA